MYYINPISGELFLTSTRLPAHLYTLPCLGQISAINEIDQINMHTFV